MPLRHSIAYDIIFFIALLTTALALGAALAHALELLNKIHLAKDEYFIVQQAYRGWDRLGYLLAVELIAMLLVAALSRHEPRVLWPTITAIVCLIGAQAVFWSFTYPANVVTNNWTAVPAQWEDLRARWEYSHLAGAAFQVMAMSALIIAVLARTRLPG
jgi:hypothetical protein